MLQKIKESIDKFDLFITFCPNKSKLYLISFISIFFGGIVLKLNLMTPMWSDDFIYSLVYNTSDEIESISDLVLSQYKHYMHWGGRTVAHTIAQILLILNPVLSDVLNSLAYSGFVLAIYMHAKGIHKEHKIILFALINLLIWFFIPYYGETVLWITGSANYMWCSLIILLYLLPYRLYRGDRISIHKLVMYSIGMFFLGILAGWTNENVAFAMILMSILWVILYRKQSWSIPPWAILGILGSVIGYGLLMLAPGNFERFAVAGGAERNYNLFFVYFKFNMYTARLFNMIGFLAVLSCVFLVLVLNYQLLNKNYVIFSLLIYLSGILVPVYFMIFSPTFPDRAWFGTVTFAIIFFSVVFYEMNPNLSFIRYIHLAMFTLFVMGFLFNFYAAYKDIKHIDNLWKQREQLILDELEDDSVDTIRIPALNFPNSRYTLYDASFASEGMSNYYKKKILIVDP